MHLYPPEDNMDFAENPRGPGVTRAPLWVSPGTPARPCLFSGYNFGGPLPSFWAAKFGKPVKGDFLPLE